MEHKEIKEQTEVKNKYERIKKRTFEIIQVGEAKDFASRCFDMALIVLIGVNVGLLIISTFDSAQKYMTEIRAIEYFSTFLFTIEYILRIWTSDLLYPRNRKTESAVDFIFSPFGIIDLLAILPYYIPAVFPTGFVAMRSLRAVRILRLFRVNRHYDSLMIIARVVRKKKGQLVSSLFIILVMMIAASLMMFQTEHEAQPEVFDNILTSMWFVVANVSTTGYGDVYPITALGKILSMLMTFLGIGLVAIPTGIISAGFVEQMAEAKRMEEHERRKVQEEKQYCPYCGKKLD
ncbi:MAG: ion transporter [Anaerovoracaceae bacterium]